MKHEGWSVWADKAGAVPLASTQMGVLYESGGMSSAAVIGSTLNQPLAPKL
jgi:hypothetical protein